MKKRGGGTQVVQKQKQARVDKKKPCDLGSSCPYQEEFQHLMEFSHECQPVRNQSRTSGFGSSSGSSSSSSAGVNWRSSGSGHRLGGGEDNRIGRLFERNFDQGIENGHDYVYGDDDRIQCQMCSARVSISELERHMQSHERKDDRLKAEQDQALEQSILDDIQRQSLLEAEQIEKRRKEELALRKVEFMKQVEASRVAAAKGK